MLNSLIMLYYTLINSKINQTILVQTNKETFLVIKKNKEEYIVYENIDSSILSLKHVLNMFNNHKIILIRSMHLNSKTVYPEIRIKRSNSI